MGIETKDCLQVGQLIGIKIFLTDIVAYTKLADLLTNRKLGLNPQLSVSIFIIIFRLVSILPELIQLVVKKPIISFILVYIVGCLDMWPCLWNFCIYDGK